jgi:hypothetical protein
LNLRTGSLADLGPAELDELRVIGETLFVERKRTHKPVHSVLAPAVASMANTLGGWVLLGIEDDRGNEPGKVVGWEPRGRASAQDYLRDLLRSCIDPVPPFAAKVVELDDGQTVGVVRVAESVDVPHVVAPSGSVWTRGQGGKEPVTSHRDLMALAARGHLARTLADERLNKLDHVERVLDRLPDHMHHEGRPPEQVIIRIAPIVVPETFADAALSEATAQRAIDEVWRALKGDQDPGHVMKGPLEPLARGLRVFGLRQYMHGLRALIVDLVLDAGGVAAARFTRQEREPDYVNGHRVIADARLAIAAAASLLQACGAVGRCLIRCDYTADDDPQIGFEAAIGSGKRGEDTTVMTENLALPLDDYELDRVEGRWLRELARACGRPMWERMP